MVLMTLVRVRAVADPRVRVKDLQPNPLIRVRVAKQINGQLSNIRRRLYLYLYINAFVAVDYQHRINCLA